MISFPFRLKSIALSMSLITLLTACGGGGDSNTNTNIDTDTNTDTDTDTTTATTESLILPKKLDVVTASGGSSTSSNKPGFYKMMFNFDDPGTDYSTDEQFSHVWSEALEPVETVNDILCFASQMKANAFVNEGPYLALVDERRCFSEEGGNEAPQSGGQTSSSSESDIPSYMEVVVDSTRASDSDPLIVSAWIKGMPGGGDGSQMEGGEESIKFKATVYEGATEENPFGRFQFNFQMQGDMSNDATAFAHGEVKTVDTLDGFIGFTFFEGNINDSFGSFSDAASVVMSEDKSDGIALTGYEFSYNDGAEVFSESKAFALAFNTGNVLMQSADTYSELPYKNDDSTGSCSSREEFDEAVWNYVLYDAGTGERTVLNSGFPFRYDSDGDGNLEHGHIGYWGVWTESEAGLDDGATIVRHDFQSDTQESYTVETAPGRLIKNTVETLPLSELGGLQLFYWDDSAQQSGYEQWIVEYKTVSADAVGQDGFYKTAGMNWGENGQQMTPLDPVELLDTGTLGFVHFYSQQLGGGVQYQHDGSGISFFREEYVNGSESEQFDAAGNLDLVCYQNCPIGTMTTADLQTWWGEGSPWVQNESEMGGPPSEVNYTFSSDGDSALTLIRDENIQAATFAAGMTREDLQQTQFSWGLRSGSMVTPEVAATLQNPRDIHNPEVVTEFYVWETGLDQWQHTTVVKDASNQIVSFDKPIEFSYRHTDVNDRNGDAGDYANQMFMVGYGGEGQFWGVPHSQFGEHWFPAFSIADGTLMGPNDEYVIKARDIDMRMASADGQCTDLQLNDPPAPLPEEVSDSADIGLMPVVDGAPKVIDGVVQ